MMEIGQWEREHTSLVREFNRLIGQAVAAWRAKKNDVGDGHYTQAARVQRQIRQLVSRKPSGATARVQMRPTVKPCSWHS